MKKYSMKVVYNKDKVLRVLNCHKSDAVYNQSMEILDQVINENISKINPIAWTKEVTSDSVPSVAGLQVVNRELTDESIACILTLGHEIDEAINGYFDNGLVYEGMLLSGLADQILFNGTKDLHENLERDLGLDGRFLSRRHDPGSVSVPMENQRVLLGMMNEFFGEEEVNISLSDGLMFKPSKTMSYFYNLTRESEEIVMEHDCSICEVDGCPYRQVVIEVHSGHKVERFKADNTDNLLQILRDHDIVVDSPCGGNKTCGKCKVKVINNPFTYETSEKDFLAKEEIEDGIVLACHHTLEEVESKLVIEIEDFNDQAYTGGIVSDFKEINVKENKYKECTHLKYGVAIDIGTTTVVSALVELNSGKVLQTERRLNPQKSYGADIISRIMHVNQNKDHKLGLSIRNTLADEIKSLLAFKVKGNEVSVDEIVISGNTTMIYFLMGYDPEALAVSPFKTRDNDLITGNVHSLFDDLLRGIVKADTKITVLPWISAYVGGDIVSGIYGSSLYDVQGNVLFIDIGTNGEIVFKTDTEVYAAATAAGPAFEGGNIICGIGNVKGAISEVKYLDGVFETKTINDEEPLGICGSAIVDIVSILHREGIVTDTGFMEKEVTISGDIKIYPKDIRQVQLAKAAVMAGMQILVKEAGMTMDDVDYLYIAGGFGKHLSKEQGAAIGLIPIELIDRTEIVGNTSLSGAIRYLIDSESEEEINKIKDRCHYLELSTHMEFNMLYVEEMGFKARS